MEYEQLLDFDAPFRLAILRIIGPFELFSDSHKTGPLPLRSKFEETIWMFTNINCCLVVPAKMYTKLVQFRYLFFPAFRSVLSFICYFHYLRWMHWVHTKGAHTQAILRSYLSSTNCQRSTASTLWVIFVVFFRCNMRDVINKSGAPNSDLSHKNALQERISPIKRTHRPTTVLYDYSSGNVCGFHLLIFFRVKICESLGKRKQQTHW